VVHLKKSSENKISESSVEQSIIYFKSITDSNSSLNSFIVAEVDVRRTEFLYWVSFLNLLKRWSKKTATKVILKIKTGSTGLLSSTNFSSLCSLNKQIIALKSPGFLPVVTSSNLASDLRRCQTSSSQYFSYFFLFTVLERLYQLYQQNTCKRDLCSSNLSVVSSPLHLLQLIR
jgi:hypothetical protein